MSTDKKPATENKPKLLAEEGATAKWKSWNSRFLPTWLMIFGFLGVVALGPHVLFLLVCALQVTMYREVLSHCPYRTAPRASLIKWYWLAVGIFGAHGGLLNSQFGFLPWDKFAAVCLGLFAAGIVMFVMALIPGQEKEQFGAFAWTLMALFFGLSLATAHLINMINQGVLWFILPACLVISNDTWAYVWGFLIGRTPLIKISPKKTVEGFVGGGFSTIGMGLFLTSVMYAIPFFNPVTCPVDFSKVALFYPACTRLPLHTFSYVVPLPGFIASTTGLSQLLLTPFQVHVARLAVLTSLIAPFGGLFASGVKRALGLKDFGDIIPGHGGVTDRFDVQLMNGILTLIYCIFVKPTA